MPPLIHELHGLPSPLRQSTFSTINSTGTSTNNRKKKRTPNEYAKAVDVHASRRQESTLYPGINYRTLALFLKVRTTKPIASDTFTFAILHSLAFDVHDPRRITGFQTPSELESYEPPNGAISDSGQILFLRGHPSSDWVNTIGARYRVDPEVFRRHLPHINSEDFFDLPALPSYSDNIVKLRVPTIGRCTAHTMNRVEGRRETERYWKTLGADGIIGESIVRRFSWHNTDYFTIEQHMMVTIKRKGSKWIAIVLLDSGRDLQDCPKGPWFRELDSMIDIFLPIIQLEPEIALKDPIGGAAFEQPPSRSRSHQSASLPALMPLGTRLDQEAMKHDPFYALHEIFFFSASAISQFLNFLATQDNAADQNLTSQARIQTSLDTLLYHNEILQDYVEYLQGIALFLHDVRKMSWAYGSNSNNGTTESTGATNRSAVYENASERLQRSFEHLHTRAAFLFSRGQDKVNNIRSTVMVEESRRAFEQQQAVAKLTRLAFFFIPLSFVCSFFGMNFKQLGQGTLHIWIFFVAAGVLSVISMVFLFWEKSWAHVLHYFQQR